MQFLRRALFLGLTAAGVAVPVRRGVERAALPSISGRGDSTSARKIYAASDAEFYMSEDQIGYIRPGLHVTVNSVVIPADLRPVVDFSLSDDFNQPLDRAGQVTPGPISVSFILDWWDPVTRHYTAYTTRTVTTPASSPHPGVTAVQAGTDANGTFTDLSLGHATYRFKTMLPSGYDVTKTHTLGLYATRTLTDILNKNYYANAEFDFRPDAGAVTDVWDKTTNSRCNSCHNPLSAHGGARQDVKLCVLCHQPQTVDPDTGNTLDFKVLIHKIHDGANLPSVAAGTPYEIIGFNQAVTDFSKVKFPQDIRNCTTCHAAPATQAANFFTDPSRAACGSCHDDVSFATGVNHPGGIQVDDSKCATCHQPQGVEFDASVLGAHTIPLKSKQLPGLKVEIVNAANTSPGQNPTVTFKITNGDGAAVDPKTLGSNLNLILGGPTVDYSINPFRERADGAAFNGTLSTYTFHAAIPANATGTWAIAAEARRTVTIDVGDSDQNPSVTEGAINPVFYIPVTDSTPQPRRQVVDIAKCNVCHDQLSLHGGQRFVVEECVICHNPNANDKALRPADAGSPESISFQRLIHRIHTGENLTHDYTIYGFGGSVNNFNDVLFPGDTRDCQKCHVAGAYTPPLPLTNLPVQTPPPPQEWYTPQQTTAAACLGCHDTQEAAAHAFVMTAPFGESCAACHAADDEFAVDRVHAR
ncbi:MAG: OmcA/MtrC family decaheme c-type cytochrome [Thermoanaerobaculia bacterium]